jgi:hypothetical protein
LGQAINAVAETRRLGFVFFLRMFLTYTAVGIAHPPLFRNGSYTSLLSHKRCSNIANLHAVALMAFLPVSATRWPASSPSAADCCPPQTVPECAAHAPPAGCADRDLLRLMCICGSLCREFRRPGCSPSYIGSRAGGHARCIVWPWERLQLQ